jgi:uncharacterized protein YjbI with pentapeptide repeats
VIAFAAVTALLIFVDDTDPRNQIELIKTGLTIGAGTGGVVALVLSGRRQWSTEHDATERRLTELYLKAVEQLGSDKAAVRHGGLYALERVAQDNPAQRQTVVDVLCAYLRGPFEASTEVVNPCQPGIRRPLLASPTSRLRQSNTDRDWSLPAQRYSAVDAEMRQERQVRLAAQGILRRHLQPGLDVKHRDLSFWSDITIDLADATLIDFDLSNCHVNHSNFARARFVGIARFRDATFTGDTSFVESTFAGHAVFFKARFLEGGAWFSDTKFSMSASFESATFTELTYLDDEMFMGGVSFRKANFAAATSFKGVSFAKSNLVAGVKTLTWAAGSFADTEFRQGVPDELVPYLRDRDQWSSPDEAK